MVKITTGSYNQPCFTYRRAATSWRIFTPMRSMLLCIVLLCLLENKTYAQAVANLTDVTIIGLNHKGNKVYNVDTLVKVLLRL